MSDKINLISFSEHDHTISHNVVIWRVINLLMSVFFMLAVLVNVNDEDWYLWMPMYGIPGLLAAVLIFWPQAVSESSLWMKTAVADLAFSVGYMFYQIVVFIQVISSDVQNPLKHEEGREMAGLLIIITWLVIFRFTNVGRPDASLLNKNMMKVLVTLAITLATVPMITWSLCFIGDWHQKLGHCTGMF